MLIKGLGGSRFYEYFSLVKQLFFRNDPLSDEPELRNMLLYAEAIDSFRKTYDEHYRMLSLGKADEAAFERSLLKEAERLWLAISFERERPDFSLADFCAEMKARFGVPILLGRTPYYKGKELFMGHLVDQQKRKIEQYGFESEFSYLAYDMMVSNGYVSWFFDGTFFVGGWATTTEMAEGSVRVTVHRLRRRYRKILRDEIAQTVADEDQIDEEMGHLFAALAH